jgi:hypothetical protein
VRLEDLGEFVAWLRRPPGMREGNIALLPSVEHHCTEATVNRKLLRHVVKAASDDDGWAHLGPVGHIIIKQRPDFDARTYGYTKLRDLFAATTLFELDHRRTPRRQKGSRRLRP